MKSSGAGYRGRRAPCPGCVANLFAPEQRSTFLGAAAEIFGPRDAGQAAFGSALGIEAHDLHPIIAHGRDESEMMGFFHGMKPGKQRQRVITKVLKII